MDKPLCKVCMTKHWLSEGHNWPKETVVTPPMVITSGVNKPKVRVSGVNKVKSGVVLTDRRNDRHSPGYMRDYMRRLRAKTSQ